MKLNYILLYSQPDFDDTVKIIETALDVGYRHLDTAQVYKTEPMVGQAIKNKIKEGAISRQDVFVTTKVCYMHIPYDVRLCGMMSVYME